MLTITIKDSETGQELYAQVDHSGGEPVVREISLRAENGHGITADLSRVYLPDLVKSLGLSAVEAPIREAEPVITQTAPAKATKKPAAKKATAKAPAARQSAKKAPAKAQEATGERRPYRNYPGHEAVAAAILQAGAESATEIGKNLDVPRHTAQGWLRQYRAHRATFVPPQGDTDA